MPDFIHAQPWYLSLQQGPILASGAVLVAAGLVYAVRDTREYAPGREHGDARWGTARELKSFKNKKIFRKISFSDKAPIRILEKLNSLRKVEIITSSLSVDLVQVRQNRLFGITLCK